MDRSSMAEIETAHLCRHCENIIFILGESISFLFSEVKRAHEAGCKFFQLILDKYSIKDSPWLSCSPTLVVYCDVEGKIDFCWMDGAIKLLDSLNHSIDASPMFARKDGPAPANLEVGPLNSTPGSKESFRVIHRWIRRCDKRHKRCKILRKALSRQGSARLIDVGNVGSENICLCPTVPESAVQYAALSYCWGVEQESKTVEARLKERYQGFPLSELSKTIQDAVVTTRILGLRYLWVDAVCIIQDNKADVERELLKMDQIYSGASITIVAARAGKAADGFLERRDVIRCYGTLCRVKYRRSSEGNGEVGPGFLSANRLDITWDDPIDLRGWTFQERFRSFRTLRFGSKQTVWECPEIHYVDGGEDSVEKSSSECLFTGTIADLTYPYQLNDPSQKHELNWVLQTWQDLVGEYSKRTLGHRTDRLPAFSAMAKALGTFLQLDSDQYLAGLWSFDICMQLRWRRPEHALEGAWCNERQGPTWSWASLDGPVTFDHPRLLRGVDTLQVVKDEHQIRWKSSNFKYGEVEFARLTVYGYLRQSIWMKEKLIGWHQGTRDFFLLPLKAHWDYHEERPPEVWCLEINTYTSENEKISFGLLLAKSIGNIFNRLGYFEFYHDDLQPEPIKAGLDIRGLPLNSNWFYNGGQKKILIE